jgi:ParB family chromosome partitioning protein
MGRGLAAILPEHGSAPDGELRELPIERIRPNPRQPRRRIDPESISLLAESIAVAGVIQPLLVRPLPDGSYELIAGERRWRAAREAALATVPALLRDEDESERLQTALIENVAREDLNPIDEARACAALVEDLGLTKEEVARRLGRSRSAVSNLIRLLDLPDEALGLLESGELSEGHGRAVLLARGNDVRRKLAREAATRAARRPPDGEGDRSPGPARRARARRRGARVRARMRGRGPHRPRGPARRAPLRRSRRAARLRPRLSLTPGGLRCI